MTAMTGVLENLREEVKEMAAVVEQKEAKATKQKTTRSRKTKTTATKTEQVTKDEQVVLAQETPVANEIGYNPFAHCELPDEETEVGDISKSFGNDFDIINLEESHLGFIKILKSLLDDIEEYTHSKMGMLDEMQMILKLYKKMSAFYNTDAYRDLTSRVKMLGDKWIPIIRASLTSIEKDGLVIHDKHLPSIAEVSAVTQLLDDSSQKLQEMLDGISDAKLGLVVNQLVYLAPMLSIFGLGKEVE